MKRVGLVWSDKFKAHNYDLHPENKYRLEAIEEGLAEKGLFSKVELITPFPAEKEIISLNHDIGYINQVERICRQLEVIEPISYEEENSISWLDADTYVNAWTFEVSRLAVGGVLSAGELLLKRKLNYVFAAIRPPGHHAEYSRGMGFCIFNNIAILAKYLLREGVKKIFIVDFDAHHGNGTQKAFYTNPQVFYFSTHQYPFYPYTGKAEERGEGEGLGTTLNIPMPAYAGDEEYRKAYGKILPKVVEEFQPEIILVSAGYDLHKEDPLTQLEVSDNGVIYIVENILKISKKLNIPAMFLLEGGYNLEVLKRLVPATIELMLSFSV
jgi:acetoin utilization deacetylase AcuC-like enzyme